MPRLLNTDAIYVGIDPGKAGGLVALFPSGEIRCEVMPETEYDLWAWFTNLNPTGIRGMTCPIVAVIERVASSPQMGVSSAFTFGKGYGGLRMALTAIEASWEDITPQTWMKALHIPSGTKSGNHKDQKLKLKKVAQQLYPKLPIWSEPKSLGRQMAICDALLIATYCERKHKGTL